MQSSGGSCLGQKRTDDEGRVQGGTSSFIFTLWEEGGRRIPVFIGPYLQRGMVGVGQQ